MGKPEAEELEARLALMKSRIAALRERLRTAQGEVKGELQGRLDAACGREGAERQKLQELMDKGLKEWDAIAESAGNAWQDLERALEEIAAKLKS